MPMPKGHIAHQASPYRVGSPVVLVRQLRIPQTSVLSKHQSKIVPGARGIVAACDWVGQRWLVHLRFPFCRELVVIGDDGVRADEQAEEPARRLRLAG